MRWNACSGQLPFEIHENKSHAILTQSFKSGLLVSVNILVRHYQSLGCLFATPMGLGNNDTLLFVRMCSSHHIVGFEWSEEAAPWPILENYWHRLCLSVTKPYASSLCFTRLSKAERAVSGQLQIMVSAFTSQQVSESNLRAINWCLHNAWLILNTQTKKHWRWWLFSNFSFSWASTLRARKKSLQFSKLGIDSTKTRITCYRWMWSKATVNVESCFLCAKTVLQWMNSLTFWSKGKIYTFAKPGSKLGKLPFRWGYEFPLKS